MKFLKSSRDCNLSKVSCLEIGKKIWFHQIDIILGFNLMWNIYLSICWIFDCNYSLYVKILGLDSHFSRTMTTIFTSIETAVFFLVFVAVFFKTTSWMGSLRSSLVVLLVAIMLLVDTLYTVFLTIDVYFAPNPVLNIFWLNDFYTMFPGIYDPYIRESYRSRMITRTFWILPAVLLFKLISATVVYQNKDESEELNE